MTVNSILTMLKALIDIALVWILVYAVLKNLKNNVKMVMLLKGALIIIIVKVISDYFNLITIGLILEYILTWGTLALIIIFQPEIRNALEQLGKKQILTRHRSLTLDEREKVVYEIMNSIEEGVKERKSRSEIEEYCKNKYKEVSALQEKVTQATMKQQVGNINKNYLTEIYDHVSKVPGKLTEYDDVFARQTVTKVRILSENQIDVTLYGAVTFTIDI